MRWGLFLYLQQERSYEFMLFRGYMRQFLRNCNQLYRILSFSFFSEILYSNRNFKREKVTEADLPEKFLLVLISTKRAQNDFFFIFHEILLLSAGSNLRAKFLFSCAVLMSGKILVHKL